MRTNVVQCQCLLMSHDYCLSFIGPHFKFMAVGGTPVGPVLAGPILARASYIKVFIFKNW